MIVCLLSLSLSLSLSSYPSSPLRVTLTMSNPLFPLVLWPAIFCIGALSRSPDNPLVTSSGHRAYTGVLHDAIAFPGDSGLDLPLSQCLYLTDGELHIRLQ